MQCNFSALKCVGYKGCDRTVEWTILLLSAYTLNLALKLGRYNDVTNHCSIGITADSMNIKG